ncbi:unnamed protein product [Moneuplotes crassus]|uniref:RBR-type E3 ubiquitin transferase n=1 Tax=Euplotes crassus TaxID=5936 RepID=A0AAD1UN95_EUPCR|nr:unnamed protein product [Moneuplotes crassus]
MNKPAKKLVKNAKPSSKSIFGDIASLQNYDPVLLFLIGYNYAKFEATNSDPNFVSIAGELQKALSQLGNTSGDRLEIYDRLYSQENLNEVLSLRCLQNKVVKAKAPNKQNSNRAKCPKSEARARQPNAVVQNNGSEMYPELGEFRNPALPLYDFEPVNVYPAFLQENFGNEDAKIAPEMPVQKKKLDQQDPPEPVDNRLECGICYEKIELSEILFMDCAHSYCKDCIQGHINSKVEERVFPIKCPDENCAHTISDEELQEFLNSFQDYAKVKMEETKLSLEQSDEVYYNCLTPDCKNQFVHSPDGEDYSYTCFFCHKSYCLRCKVEWHENFSCEEYRKYKGYPEEDRQFQKYLDGTPFKQCPKCGHWVEKVSGCNHITCRCKYEFCYICTAKHKTCNC